MLQANKLEVTEDAAVLGNREMEQNEIQAIVTKLEKSYRQSQLNQRVLEFLGFYVRLEQFYMDETIKPVRHPFGPHFVPRLALLLTLPPQAIGEESVLVVPTETLTASFVDDVFFVLKEVRNSYLWSFRLHWLLHTSLPTFERV